MSNNTGVNETLHDVDDIAAEPSQAAVTKYLLEHPSFLIENPDVLLEIQVALQENGVVSLTQIQTEQYREKIKQLKLQLDRLLTNARNNEQIYTTYATLNIEISKAESIEKIQSVLEEHLLDILQLEAVNLIVLSKDDSQSSKPKLSEIQQYSMFEKKLAKSPFYLGRLGKLEKETLFPTAQANSVAIVQIGDASPIGLLAVASEDAVHFGPKMDTTLLDFLRLALNFHIPRLL